MGCKYDRPAQPPPPDIQKTFLVGPQLLTPSDLTGYPTFPPGTKSLLKKHLTRDIWGKLHDRVDSTNFSFKQVIFSGCKNNDGSIGIYAGSGDSYIVFKDLFDNVIEEFHKVKRGLVRQVTDMDAGKLSVNFLSLEEQSMIVCSRIRVSRNFNGYPFCSNLNKNQRIEIMQKVELATKKLEMKGNWYQVQGLKEEEKNELKENGFLFNEGNKFLQSAGISSDFPIGRSIYHSLDKTLLIWVNEEDHIRIISMQHGGDIYTLFDRVSKVCSVMEQQVGKFEKDDQIGYLNSCPTNIGTAMRISIHIRLPKLIKQWDELGRIAEKYQISIRGIHAENLEQNEPILEISNKKRLGKSERQFVQDVCDATKAMIDLEKSI